MTKKVARTPDDVVLSQRQAQRLVGDPEVAATFEELKEGYIGLWSRTAPDESEKREMWYRHYKAIADVWAALGRKAQAAHVRDLKQEAEGKAKNG